MVVVAIILNDDSLTVISFINQQMFSLKNDSYPAAENFLRITVKDTPEYLMRENRQVTCCSARNLDGVVR